ncbi:hypothetical protein BN8_03999 [Fibrisoma limi BUZ 3]|uniref:Uncharacterized protein n=1 Tax=Fibrisoma limi BUZ 3 TaxID=1185876 RepID=I2GLL8_9BACT|nr:hypothetical protein BN8_03999 [Fibrisoma limi BUZ 3]
MLGSFAQKQIQANLFYQPDAWLVVCKLAFGKFLSGWQ